MRLETGDGDCDTPESRSLAQQNVDLRRRLDEEQAAYKRKLTAYQEGQQRQAQLVQKLQAKVRWCDLFLCASVAEGGKSIHFLKVSKSTNDCVKTKCSGKSRSDSTLSSNKSNRV